MTSHRLFRLPKQSLRWLVADQQRTKGGLASGQVNVGKALPTAQGPSSRSLRRLEEQGWMAICRTRGGKAASLPLPPPGR